MSNKQMILSVVAAILFLGGLVLMLFVVPTSEPAPATEPGSTSGTTEPSQEVMASFSTEPLVTEPEETEPVPVLTTDTTPPAELGLTAAKAFVYDTGSDHMMYAGGDPDEELSPASLTKLLTAYTVRQCLDEETIVTVGEEVTWIDIDSSRAWLEPGHQLTVRMLIQGMMLPSGNDAAYTLAVAGGRELAEDPELDRRQAYNLFVDEMNAQARALGMTGSHFMNPDGIDAEGHYTTVNDLLIITKAVLNDPLIMEFAGMAEAEVVFASGETATWYNSNYLLHEEMEYYTPEAVGLKTGSTDGAGKCLISLFEKADGGYLIVGVLGSIGNEERYTDTLALYNLYK